MQKADFFGGAFLLFCFCYVLTLYYMLTSYNFIIYLPYGLNSPLIDLLTRYNMLTLCYVGFGLQRGSVVIYYVFLR
jgi:hypothetical protein